MMNRELTLPESLMDTDYRSAYASSLCEEYIQRYPEPYFKGLPFTPHQWVTKAIEAALMDAYWAGREDEVYSRDKKDE